MSYVQWTCPVLASRQSPPTPWLARGVQRLIGAVEAVAGHLQVLRARGLAAIPERAVRFGAFSLAAIRRILAAQAKPKPLLAELADLQREMLDPLLRQEPIGPRPTSDYQHLLSPEEVDESPSEENPQDQPDNDGHRSEPA
jgi:hypothetical protein